MDIKASEINNNNGSIRANHQLSMEADTLNNQQGTITSVASEAAINITNNIDNSNQGVIRAETLNIQAQNLNNDEANLLATKAMSLDINSLNNQTGLIYSKEMNIDLNENLNNSTGEIRASDLNITTTGLSNNTGKIYTHATLSITSETLENQRGNISSGDHFTLNNSKDINNQSGQIFSTQNLNLSADNIDNNQGTIGSANQLSITTKDINNNQGLISASLGAALVFKSINNQQGEISSLKALNLTGTSIDSSQGALLASNALAINLSGSLNNNKGRLGSSQSTASLAVASLNNEEGTISATENLSINAQGIITNTSGSISSSADIQLQSTTLSNDKASITAGKKLNITATGITNTEGSISSTNEMSISADEINSTKGQISSASDISLNLGNEANNQLNNQQGLILAAGKLSINAHDINNSNTIENNQGIQAGQLEASDFNQLNNQQGQITSQQNIVLTGEGINNKQGKIGSQQNSTLTTTKIDNSAGTLLAKKNLAITSKELTSTSESQITAYEQLSLKLNESYTHYGDIVANNLLDIEITKNLSNHGNIESGGNLSIDALNLTNESNSNIKATNIKLTIGQLLVNRTLINGSDVTLSATQIDNHHKIYGDQLVIEGSQSLNNKTNAVIAARQNLEIGTATLNNEENALLYSQGHINIGKAINNENKSQGRANTINNNGGRIEAQGNMSIAVNNLNNTNSNYVTKVQTVKQDPVSTYYVGRDAAIQEPDHGFHESEVHITRWSGRSEVVHYLVLDDRTYQAEWEAPIQDEYGNITYAILGYLPDGRPFYGRSEDYYIFKVSHTTKKTVVDNTNPGEIISGGNMHWDISGTVNNEQSRIIAGGNLTGNSNAIVNAQETGHQNIIIEGTKQYTESHTKRSGCCSKKHVRGWGSTDPYQTIKSSTFDLGISTLLTNHNETKKITIEGQSEVAAPQHTLKQKEIQSTQYETIKTGQGESTISAQSNTLEQLNAIKPIEAVNIITFGDQLNNIQLPTNVFYTINTTENHNYIVESDPAFADYDTWASSDYMLEALSLQPDQVLQRIGDGFYEQQLITEQIISATGQRYIGDYSSNQEQYMALMNAGISFSQEFDLNVGTALTQAQMQQLTEDMVWLVEKEITLPNGQQTLALVPQVYIQLQPGDLNPDGSIISARNVELNVAENIDNSGLFMAEESLALRAENINNSRGIQAQNINLEASQDINNLSASIRGNKLNLSAGRDINNITQIQEIESLTEKRIDAKRIASIEGANSLTINSGRDINIKGAELISQGDISLAAENEANIHSVKTSRDHTHQGSNHQYHLQQTNYLGSEVTAGGYLSISGKNLIDVMGSNLQSGSDTTLKANSVNIAAQVETQQIESSYKSKKSSGSYQRQQQNITGGNLQAGGNLNIESHTDINLTGTQIAVAQDINLSASQDINIEAIVTEDSEHRQTEKKGTIKSKQSDKGFIKQTAEGGTLSASNLNINTQGDVNLKAVTLAAKESLQIGNNEILRDEAGNPLLDENGQYQTTDGAASNINISTLTLQDESWSKSSSSYRGIAKDLVKVGQAAASLLNSVGIDTPEMTISESTSTRETSTTHQGSQLIADDIKLQAEENIHLINADITGNTGEIEAKNILIDAVANTSSSSHSESKTVVGGEGAELSQDQLSLGTIYEEKNTQTTTTTTTTHDGSSLNFTESLDLTAAEDIDVYSSEIIVKQQGEGSEESNLNINAQNLNVGGYEDTTTTTTTSEQKRTELTLGVRNAYVDTAQAVDALAKGTEAMKAAEDALSQAKKAVDNGTMDASDLKYYEANLVATTANVAQLTTAMLASVAAAGTAAATSAGTGFYATGGATTTTTTTTNENKQSQFHGSSIAGGNVSINVKEKLTAEGSRIHADQSMEVAAKTIELKSGQSHSESSTSQHTEGASASASSSNPTGINANKNWQESKSQSESTTHTLSQLSGSDIKITSDELALNGATITGTSEQGQVQIETEQLTITTVQNTSSSQNESKGGSVGIGFTRGGGSGNGQFNGPSFSANESEGSSQSQWAAEQSGITGSGQVTITADHTEMTAGLIAAGQTDEEGNWQDNGQLTFTTETINTTGLENFSTSDQHGMSFGMAGVGFEQRHDSKGNVIDGSGYITGTTTAGLSVSKEDKESITRSTIGGGQISIGGSEETELQLASLGINTDVNQVEEITKDQSMGVDMNLSIDNRMLTEGGWDVIENDAKRAENFVNDEIIKGIKEGIKSDGNALTNIVSAIDRRIDTRAGIEAAHQDKEVQEGLNTDEASVEEKEQASQDLSNLLTGENETSDQRVYVYADENDEEKGFYHQESGSSHINATETNMVDGEELVGVITHETSHHILHEQASQYSDTQKETAAKNDAIYAQELWQQYNEYSGITTGGDGQAWLAQQSASPTLQNNTQRASSIPQSEREQLLPQGVNDFRQDMREIQDASKKCTSSDAGCQVLSVLAIPGDITMDVVDIGLAAVDKLSDQVLSFDFMPDQLEQLADANIANDVQLIEVAIANKDTIVDRLGENAEQFFEDLKAGKPHAIRQAGSLVLEALIPVGVVTRARHTVDVAESVVRSADDIAEGVVDGVKRGDGDAVVADGIGNVDNVVVLKGVGSNANFAQKTFSEVFSKGGKFAGQSIDDVAGALRSGSVKASDVPIDVITRNGKTLILNTRSAQALTRAGIPRSKWNAVNRTGQKDFEGRLSDQLRRNKLTDEGIPSVRSSN